MGKIKWTYEKCKEEASKYEYRSDFKKTGRAYVVARQNKWLDDWFNSEFKCKWTYNKCLEESKKYKFYSEFNSNNYVAYNKVLLKGWIKDFTWLTDDRGVYDTTSKMYCVYKYEWPENKTIYIGLTKNLKERDRGHKKTIKKRGKLYESSVKKYSDKNNLEIPSPITIEDKLTSFEAREKEDYWVKYYTEKKWNVLNEAKTGIKSGSIGGPVKKWDYDSCYKEAKKYKSRSEFQKLSYGAYRVAHRNNWIDEYPWMKPKIHPNGYWNYERCFEEAKKYEHKSDFERKSHSSFVSAKNNGWLKDYKWLKLKRNKKI